VSLGRSVWSVRGSFPCRQPHRRQQVPSGCRGGERRQHAPSARTLRGDAQEALSTLEDTSFARSRDPCTSIATEHICVERKLHAAVVARVASVSRSGKPAQAGGTGTGAFANGRMRGSPRVTASRKRRSCVTRQKQEGGHGLRPCEETRAPVGVRTSCSLQKSAGRVLAPNKLARSAPKRVAVRVNGGLAGELRDS
jgi:hypothetical protein